MYKNNSRISSKIKGCSPLKLSCNLTGKRYAICHYSYNLPLCTIEMKKIIYLILIFLVIGCQESAPNKENNILKKSEDQSSNSKKDKIDLNSTNQLEIFEISDFKKSIDSFLVSFTGIQTTYQLTIDTINDNLHRKILYDTTLLKYLVINSNKLIHYSFDDQKTVEDLDFRIIEIQFIDSSQCKNVFNILNEYANTKSAIDNFKYIPCLTYQNDRLLMGQEKIFWLDNSCQFSYKTHKNYLTMFRNTLINFAPLDSIVCKCGDVISRK